MVNQSGRQRVQFEVAHAIAADDHCCTLSVESIDDGLQRTRRRIEVVAVQLHGKPAAPLASHSLVPASANSQIRSFGNDMHQEVGLGSDQFLEDFRRTVGGMIVDDNDIEGERRLLPHRALHGVCYGLCPIEYRNHHRGLHSKLLLAEIDFLAVASVHQSSDSRQMSGGNTLHLDLYFTVSRVHIVELPFAAPPLVALLFGIEELAQMHQLPMSAQIETKVVEGGKLIILARFSSPVLQQASPDQPQRTEIEVVANGAKLVVDDRMAACIVLPTVGIHHSGVGLFSHTHHTLQRPGAQPYRHIFQAQQGIVAVQTLCNVAQRIGRHQRRYCHIINILHQLVFLQLFGHLFGNNLVSIRQETIYLLSHSLQFPLIKRMLAASHIN